MSIVKIQLEGDITREKDQMKGEKSPKTVCNDLFFLKLVILCAVGKRKREDSDQSKRDIDMYPMKQRHHISPERDSKSLDISCGHGK